MAGIVPPGLPGDHAPLSGSHWDTGDPGTHIRSEPLQTGGPSRSVPVALWSDGFWLHLLDLSGGLRRGLEHSDATCFLQKPDPAPQGWSSDRNQEFHKDPGQHSHTHSEDSPASWRPTEASPPPGPIWQQRAARLPQSLLITAALVQEEVSEREEER